MSRLKPLKNKVKYLIEQLYCVDIRRPLPKGITYKELIPAGEDDQIATGLLTIQNGRYIYQEKPHRTFIGHSGRALTGNGRPIIDSHILSIPDRVKWYGDLTTKQFTRLKATRPRQLEGTTLLLTTLQRSNEFFHFIFDAMVNCALITEKEGGFDAYDFIVMPTFQDKAWKLYFRNKFNIPDDKIITLYDHDLLQCERLVLPVRPYGAEYIPSWVGPYAKKYLALDEPARPDYPKKLYISRADADRRQVVNEDEFTPELIQQGFCVMTLADKSIEEQQRLFRNAEIVMGPHGAGFAHIINMSPGTTLTELSPWQKIKPCFQRLCKHLNIQHKHKHCTPTGQKANMVASFINKS